MNCLKCGDETNNPKFCSKSCSASYNNIGVRRHGNPPGDCLYCGNSLAKKKNASSAKFCDCKCYNRFKYEEKIDKWLKNEIPFPGKRNLKKYLSKQKAGCWHCGITEWNKKKIVLEIEHIDGNSDNNTETNFALLCPNCHSQTPTYKYKNRGNGRHFRRKRYKEGKSY